MAYNASSENCYPNTTVLINKQMLKRHGESVNTLPKA